MMIYLIEMRVSLNRGTPISSSLMGFSIVNHRFWGSPIYGTPQMAMFVPQAATEIIEKVRQSRLGDACSLQAMPDQASSRTQACTIFWPRRWNGDMMGLYSG